MYSYFHAAVVLLVTPSSQFSSVIIRSGRMPMAISMSIKFVVNNTDKSGNVTDCLMRGDCIQACDLNFTIALSVAINVQANLLQGLIQSLNIYSIDVPML